MPNIRILAKVAPQLFCSKGCSYTKCLCLKTESNSTKNLRNRCSQGCSYTKCLCSKKGSNSTENLRNKFKIQSVHLHLGLVCTYTPNIRILAKAVHQIFCSQGCSYTKCLGPKKGSNSIENLRNMFKI